MNTAGAPKQRCDGQVMGFSGLQGEGQMEGKTSGGHTVVLRGWGQVGLYD